MASWPSALLLGTVQVVQAVLCAVHLFLFLAGPCPSHMDLRWTFSCRLCILPRREASTCGPASGARSLPSRTRPTWISSRGTCFSSGMRLLSGSSECFLVPCFSRYMSPVAGADMANLRIRPGPADSVLDLARLCFRELGRTPSVGSGVFRRQAGSSNNDRRQVKSQELKTTLTHDFLVSAFAPCLPC